MAYDPVLVPTPVAGKAVPYTWFTKLRDSIIAVRTDADVVSPPGLSASVNDWTFTGLSTGRTFRLSSTAAWNITGIVAQAANPSIVLWNRGSFTITLKHQDAASAAANRFFLPGGVDFALTLGKGCQLWYDVASTLWAVR